MRTTQAALLASSLLISLLTTASAAPNVPDKGDPFIWLESAHGERVMQWVKAENSKTAAVLEKDPHFGGLFQDAKRIVEAKDRIPAPQILNGRIYNFWQDGEHVHGIWRETSLADYQSAQPKWHTVLDLDALSKQEHANWFWKGASCAEPKQTRCMLALSDGGEDAVSLREFDLGTGQFVAGGLSTPKGKQSFSWEGDDALLVSREWSKGELTKSGYPFVVKRLNRGQALDAATEVFRGKPDDVFVFVYRYDDGDGHHSTLVEDGITFFQFDRYLVTDKGATQVSLPKDASLVGAIDNRLILDIHEDWNVAGARLDKGTLVSLDMTEMLEAPEKLKPTAVYAPGAHEAFVAASVTQKHLLVHWLDNVNGRVSLYTPEPHGTWAHQAMPLPDNAAVDLYDADLHSEHAFVRLTGFLTPPQMLLVDAATEKSSVARTLPAKFDASGHVVEQREAISKDGTHVPYFIVHPKNMKMDGSTPTLLNAYGGFLQPMTPSYSSILGKLWLEHGNSFVLANIRGGGEFGPKWHEAGLKTHRQVIYDDFTAVAKDLIDKGFTSPAHLGIFGGSNGGLLMGVEFTQHPEMFGAVDIQVPLLDMLRFEKIAAGASWVAEYGSVTNPDERKFLASISPYSNLRSGVKYPEPFIWSTSKDDRVGPQHARKFAAKLESMGLPYLYFEETEGGHESEATPTEQAQMAAREYTYFSRMLLPKGG